MAERVFEIDDALKEIYSREPNTELGRRDYLIAIEHSNVIGTPTLHSVVLNDSDDQIGTYLNTQCKKLDRLINNPKEIKVPTRTSAGGRFRSKREREQIRKSRLREYKYELAVFRGDIIAPITLIEKDNHIVGYRVSREVLDS